MNPSIARPTRRSAVIGLTSALAALAVPAVARAEDTPEITAAAWAVSDARTGQVLGSKGLEQPSKIASIAKVATALQIAELAARQPGILDEEVVFSETAVSRLGTKTGLAAGDRAKVRDALYGLLLPSGNDAGYALAQHFNARFEQAGQAADETGTRAFIAGLNRQAERLGMTQSRFRSSFGDGGTVTDRTSTPRDLLILARAAMAQPLLQRIVATRRYEARVKDAAGAERTAAWTNSNLLLERSAVTGIKTGTTRTAGACLLTEATVAGRRYHVVVLGSRTPADRFNDTLKVLATVTGHKWQG